MKKIVFPFSVLLVVAAAAGCSRFTSGRTAMSGRLPSLEALARALHAPAGYTESGEPAFFDRANLYKAIDGMAPEYISYGCRALAMLQWPSRKDPNEAIQVEIYDMGGPLGAFGIYSRAREGEGEFVDIGTEAAVAEDSLEFARGPYYVKLVGPLDSRPVLEKLGSALVGQVPPGPPVSELARALPARGRIPRTERWVPHAAFGMDFLKNVWVARYRLDGGEIELYLAGFAGDDEAREAWTKFRKEVSENRPRELQSSFPGFTYKDEWIGQVAVFQAGKSLVVVVGYNERVAAGVRGLLDEINKRG